MKKYLLSMAAVLSLGMVIVSCSSKDVYDEGNAADLKQQQRVAEYQQAFEQAFGKIAVGNDWGFGSASATRGAATTGFNQYNIPDYQKPITGKPKIDEFVRKFNAADVATDFDFSDYFLQHVIKQTGKGNAGWGTKDEHHQMAQLQAFNYNTGEWEDVTNFEKGQNTHSMIESNEKTKGTTLMVNMGTPDSRPQFRWIAKKNADVGEGYECENYVIKKVDGQYYLGMSYVNKPVETTETSARKKDPKKPKPGEESAGEPYDSYDAWIIRLVKAVGNPGYKEYGRVMCEDLGSTEDSDLDFNDVVFDAYILNDGSINITIMAAGGTLRPVTVAGVTVTLPQMCNTEYNDIVADPQEFTISAADAAKNGWTTIASIPVMVPGADGQPHALEAKSDGSAPAKVCTAVGVPWAKERVKLSLAYNNWTQYVNTTNPKLWYENMTSSNICPLFFDVTEIEGE